MRIIQGNISTSIFFILFYGCYAMISMATAQEKSHHQTPYLHLVEKTTLSGTENIHFVDALVEKPGNFVVFTNMSAVTNAQQIYVIQTSNTDIISFVSVTEKGMPVAYGKNSKATKNSIANNTPKKQPSVQADTQYQSSPIFPFFPIKFFSIEQYLGVSSTSTYPIPIKKALVSSTFSLYNNNEKLLKATIACNNRETAGTINKQLRMHTFSLPPPSLPL